MNSLETVPEDAPEHGWILPTREVREADLADLWHAIVRAYHGRTGPGPFVLGVDGRSGAGKTAMAARLADLARSVPEVSSGGGVDVFHLEDLYPGWDGLAAGVADYARILEDLRRGRAATWHRWDWATDQYDAATHRIDPEISVLIAEGVGATAPGFPAIGPHFSVWLELPADLRKHRALERDGDLYRPFWDRWAAQEEELFA